MKFSLIFIIASEAILCSNAFVPRSMQRAPVVAFMSDAPSDSSDDNVVLTVDAVPAGTQLVDNVMNELPTGLLSVTKDTRTKMNEALLKLESSNPTPEPTLSALLNGVWELKYAGGYTDEWAIPSPTRQAALFLYSGGYSPGLFALALAQQLPSQLVDVGDLEISISRSQPRVEATVGVKLLGGSQNKVVVKARLEVESAARLTETYESASVVGNNVDIPSNLQYSREMYVTYLDEDLLVVRDASGVPEVLVRKG